MTEPPSYRCYYPQHHGLRATLIDLVLDLGLDLRFADFRADLIHVLAAMRRRLPRPFVADANCQIQVLASLLFRNQTAYAVGRVVNGDRTYPFVAAIKRRSDERLYVDALLTDANRARAAVLRESRVLPGRHGGAVRLRRLPARDAARQDRVRALHDARACRSTARRSFSAISCTTSSIRPTGWSSHPASRAS